MPATDLALPPKCKVVAFVHAKATSERVPGKNLRILGDRPLICHAIANALAAKLVDAVVIDSEDDEILRVGKEAGAIPLKRPAELASDETTGHNLAHWQASNAPDASVILQVVPTSPFLFPSSIDRAAYAITEQDWVSAAGCRIESQYAWAPRGGSYETDGKLPNSQEIVRTIIETTGLYAFRRNYAAIAKRRLAPLSCLPLELSRVEAIDINTEEDFEFAEIVWSGLRARYDRRYLEGLTP